jgi:nicotinamide-nucleotide amidase
VPAEVVLHLTVGDELAVIHEGMRAALETADIVIITGGLGPTEDDLTRQAVAAYFDLALEENPEALVRLQERFARRGRSMPESNLIQAQVPAGSQIIHNDRGTASGFHLPLDGKHIFVTPGIPYEMTGMLEGFILPRVRELVGANHHIRRAALKVYGLPESGINERIRLLMARDRNPLLGLLPHRGTITIEITASGETAEEAEALLAADLAALRAELGRYIISEDERDLPQVVADLLMEHNLTVSVAELGTGGMVAARLTSPEGAERWFRRGLVIGSEQEVLGPAGPDRLAGQEAALALAEAALQAGDADIGLGVGPVILAEDSTPDRPYGGVHVGVSLRGQGTSRRISFNGDRNRVRQWAADASLAMVRMWVTRRLEGSQGDLSDWLWGAQQRRRNSG